MDQRTRAQVTAHHRAGRHWLVWMCACGVRWSQCPDAEEAQRAAAERPERVSLPGEGGQPHLTPEESGQVRP